MMNIFGHKRRDQEVMVTKLDLKKKNHYIVPTMP